MDSLKQLTTSIKEKAAEMKERASNFKDRMSGKDLPPRDSAGKLNHALKDLANKKRPQREKHGGKEEGDGCRDREGGEWVELDSHSDQEEEQFGE